jgi:hypothetical protein
MVLVQKENPMTADDIDKAFPNVADWVKERGWIEIGDRGWRGFVVCLLAEEGFCLEAGPCQSLGEALTSLEETIPDVED